MDILGCICFFVYYNLLCYIEIVDDPSNREVVDLNKNTGVKSKLGVLFTVFFQVLPNTLSVPFLYCFSGALIHVATLHYIAAAVAVSLSPWSW